MEHEVDGTGTSYAPGQEVKNLVSGNGAYFDLYAQREPIPGKASLTKAARAT